MCGSVHGMWILALAMVCGCGGSATRTAATGGQPVAEVGQEVAAAPTPTDGETAAVANHDAAQPEGPKAANPLPSSWLEASEQTFIFNHGSVHRKGTATIEFQRNDQRLAQAAGQTPPKVRSHYAAIAKALPQTDWTKDELDRFDAAMKRSMGAGGGKVVDALFRGENALGAAIQASDAAAPHAIESWRIQRIALERFVAAHRQLDQSYSAIFEDLKGRAAGQARTPAKLDVALKLSYAKKMAFLNVAAPPVGLRDAVVLVTLHPSRPKRGDSEQAELASAQLLKLLGSNAVTEESRREAIRFAKAREANASVPSSLLVLLPEVQAKEDYAIQICPADQLARLERVEVRLAAASGTAQVASVPGQADVAKESADALKPKPIRYSIKPGSSSLLVPGSVWKGTEEDYSPRGEPRPFELHVHLVDKRNQFTGEIRSAGRKGNTVHGSVTDGVIAFRVPGDWGYEFRGPISGDRIEVGYQTGGLLSASGMVQLRRESGSKDGGK